MSVIRRMATGPAILGALCLFLGAIVALELVLAEWLVVTPPAAGSEGLAVLPVASGETGATGQYDPPPESMFLVIDSRPLFSPGRRPPEAAPVDTGGDSAPVTSLEGLVLTGIIGADNERVAIVEPIAAGARSDEPMSVRVGDKLRGWTVESIGSDRLVVTNGGARQELELVNDQGRRRPAVPGQTRPSILTPAQPRLIPGVNPPTTTP